MLQAYKLCKIEKVHYDRYLYLYKVLIKFRSDFDFCFLFVNHRIGENSLKLRKPEVRVAD